MDVHNQFYPVAGLITEEERSQLVESGAAVSNQYWRWGDFVSEKVRAVQREYGDAGGALMSLYEYIGSLIGKSARSVRGYREIAEFFPPEIREVYRPLPFDIFRLAKSFGPGWRTVLDTGLRYIDTHGGRLPTREWLENFFRAALIQSGGQMADETPYPAELAREAEYIEETISDLDAAVVDRETGRVREASAVAVRSVLGTFLSFTRLFSRSVGSLPLSAETREVVQVALASMEDAIDRIKNELDP